MPKKISYVSFDGTSKEFILRVLGKSVDKQGFIIEAQTQKRVLTQDGEPLHIDDFGGVRKGSEIFFKKDLPSALEAVKQSSGSENA